MKIENALELSLPPDDAWPILLDIPFVAPCLPGTQLTGVIDDATYEGAVALRFGPVHLSFRGTAVIEEVDPEAKRVAVTARGREDRGRGEAHAKVSFRLRETEAGTQVLVVTDLNLAGSLIQYARGAGVVTRTAQELIDQFAANLQARIASGEVPDHKAIGIGSLLWKGLKTSMGRQNKAGPTDS